MRKKILVVLLVAFLIGDIYAQVSCNSTKLIQLKEGNTNIYVHLFDKEVNEKDVKLDLTYYWLKSKQLHSSKGGYEGKLLHGKFTCFYSNEALKQKGTFKKGLKNGIWKEWFINGNLKSVTYFRNGLINGGHIEFSENGNKIKELNYKQGLLHGKCYEYNDSITVIRKYRNGQEIFPKTKRKGQKSSASEHENDVEKEEKRKFNFFKRRAKVEEGNRKEVPDKNKKSKARSSGSSNESIKS